MTSKYPRSDGEYQDWEYPDQQDIEDLAAIRFEQDSSTSQGPAIPILLKIVGAVMLVGFIGSILFPVFESGGVAGNGNKATLNQTSQELQAYEKWILGNVNAATLEFGSKIKTELLGVQFDNSIENPIVGILAVRLDRHIEVEPRDLHHHSIMILELLFMERFKDIQEDLFHRILLRVKIQHRQQVSCLALVQEGNHIVECLYHRYLSLRLLLYGLHDGSMFLRYLR